MLGKDKSLESSGSAFFNTQNSAITGAGPSGIADCVLMPQI
jgi:hypothetical protein